MNLVNTREPLAWALAQAKQKLQELDPDPANVSDEDAAGELLKALLGRDLKVEALRVIHSRVEKIGRKIWSCYDTAEQLLHDIASGLIDPTAAVRTEEDLDEYRYLAPTVPAAEVRAWLARSDGETPSAAENRRGPKQKFDRDLLWALMLRDEHTRGGMKESDGEVIRRIQAACRKFNHPEPSDSTLRPMVRVARHVLAWPEPPDN